MIPGFIDRSQLPHSPGVYQFKNKHGRVIYVGKAIDLYHRVASYFQISRRANVNHIGNISPRTAELVNQIVSVKTVIVESELEALILEANLIKKYLPIFNVRLVDDKDYLYIKITKEKFPRVITARKHELKKSLKFFGPFPSSRTVRETLKALRRVFPWCANPTRGVAGTAPRGSSTRPCFYYHLGLCPGPCTGVITKQEYRKNIFRLSKLLEGKKQELVKDLVREMESSAKDQKFEEAGRIKKILQGINYLTQPNRVQAYLENPNFLEDQRQIALEALQKALNLPNLPNRIEGYDISNIQGKEATGSMVVLTNGEIDKNQYRKFKIHISGRPNDVAMHREMISRRLKHQEWQFPDLLIVDGGRGQVNTVNNELCNMNYAIPVFGLAKRLEWLYSPDGSIIKLPRKSPALHLLQKLRDEAHRFAISYHRKLHGKIILSEWI